MTPPIRDWSGPLTVHQIVAHNFRRARLAAGWTQKETSDWLEPYLGFQLRQAGVSAIERTAANRRPRNLDVADVAAFARCFGRTISWFFVPPPALMNRPVTGLGTDADGSPATAVALERLTAEELTVGCQLEPAIGRVAVAVADLVRLSDAIEQVSP